MIYTIIHVLDNHDYVADVQLLNKLTLAANIQFVLEKLYCQ